ncbi:uncharacterized protein LOC108734157 [Agrilus planipennis]|uniref:Uncharacterized protein LOC108734157 n=1 Tax=Agrilus planipennis TaxID=224129 RepID=A0A1W4WKV0_AGRPL|nr:uncharacterized protein LOC108734157 [Agrilus planipennis]
MILCKMFFQKLTINVFKLEEASYFRICRHDPNIAGCIENFLITLKPKLKEGIPELHVPPMEPLDLGEINLQTTDNHGMLNFTNLKVWGCSDYTIKNVMVDLSRHIFKYNLKLPRLYFEGNYDMDMRLLAFELKDSGFMKGNLSKFTIILYPIFLQKSEIGFQYVNNSTYIIFSISIQYVYISTCRSKI